MEAQLIDISVERSLPGGQADRSRQEALTARLDAYLRAAGAEEDARRQDLIEATLSELARCGASCAPARAKPTRPLTFETHPTWAEIIAAIDTVLAAEICADSAGTGAQSARGRIALKLGPAAAPQAGAAWSTPSRQRRKMRPQSLSLWRPRMQKGAGWLYRYQIRRTTQGLAACLCWLAVLFIP